MTWATNIAIVVVLGVWALTVIVGILDPNYEPPPGIQPLMMALAGFLFAAQRTPADRAEEEADGDKSGRGRVERRGGRRDDDGNR